MAGEVYESFFDSHVEDVVDALALVLYVEYRAFITCTVTFFARQLDVGEELHLDGHCAVTLADIAAAAGNVERKMTRPKAAALGVGLRGEESADIVESLDIGDRV